MLRWETLESSATSTFDSLPRKPIQAEIAREIGALAKAK
jgi:hypothetical protein